MAKRNTYILTFLSGFAVLIVLFLVDLSIGTSDISLSKIISVIIGNETDLVFNSIVKDIRLPKAVTAVLAGAGLSLSGLLTQTLFRNPLAGPDVLGLSSGASLGVAIVVLGGASSLFTVTSAATIGAGVVFLAVIFVSGRISNNASLLIVGLMIGALASSVIGILQFLSGANELQMFTLWTMGNISSTDRMEIGIISILIIVGLILAFSSLKSLNAWVLGEGYNRAMGLSVSSFRWKILLATCFITGGITAFCGPVSFIGIAVPHLIKRVFPSNNHQQLIPLSILGGGVLLLLCDLLTLIPGNGTILPINAATALFGAPIIIWIIIRSKKEFY